MPTVEDEDRVKSRSNLTQQERTICMRVLSKIKNRKSSISIKLNAQELELINTIYSLIKEEDKYSNTLGKLTKNDIYLIYHLIISEFRNEIIKGNELMINRFIKVSNEIVDIKTPIFTGRTARFKIKMSVNLREKARKNIRSIIESFV